jgi:hypothetical protein
MEHQDLGECPLPAVSRVPSLAGWRGTMLPIVEHEIDDGLESVAGWPRIGNSLVRGFAGG